MDNKVDDRVDDRVEIYRIAFPNRGNYTVFYDDYTYSMTHWTVDNNKPSDWICFCN